MIGTFKPQVQDTSRVSRCAGTFSLATKFKLRGGERFQEYWIPAEDLAEFNRNIIGTIEIVQKFFRNDQEGRIG